MLKKILAGCLAALVASSVSMLNSAKADDNYVQPQPTIQPHATGAPNAAGGVSYRAKELIGSAVSLDGGASVGTIDDIVIEDNGGVEFLLVINPQKQLVAVPWGATRYDIRQRVVFIHITPERFRQIPTFVVGRYPIFTAANFRTQIYGFYGLNPGQRHNGRDRDRSGRVDVKTGRIDFQGRDLNNRDNRDNRDRRDTNPPARRDDSRDPQANTPNGRTDVPNRRTDVPNRRDDSRDPATTPQQPRQDQPRPAPRDNAGNPDTRPDTPPTPAPKAAEPLPKKEQPPKKQ